MGSSAVLAALGTNSFVFRPFWWLWAVGFCRSSWRLWAVIRGRFDPFGGSLVSRALLDSAKRFGCVIRGSFRLFWRRFALIRGCFGFGCNKSSVPRALLSAPQIRITLERLWPRSSRSTSALQVDAGKQRAVPLTLGTARSRLRNCGSAPQCFTRAQPELTSFDH